MGFIREVDRALVKSIMSEFIRLQLIVGDDLNTSLWAMHADLEATTDELIRDLDIAAQNSTDLPSKNPSVRVALHRFKELVKLKLTLPLAQVDAAREDMDRFLQHRLEELHSPADMRNLIESLSQRVAAHQSRVHQIVYSEPLKHAEVAQQVLMGMAADQPVESNFFPGILEGLLGMLGIAAPGEKNPPTSSKEGAARLWASAVLDAVQKTEKRRVRLETSGSSGMPPGLHLNYEEDFLNCRSHQVPGVFTDPLFLPNMVNSVYKLVRPPVLAEAPPFTAANVLLQALPVHPQQRRAGQGYSQPLSRLLATLMQNQIKPRIWNPRKIHLTQLKCSHPHQIVPSGSGLTASQMAQRTPKMVPLPPRG